MIDNYDFISRKIQKDYAEFSENHIENDFESQNETVEELLGFLVNWLINHILKVDMLYVKK